MPQSNGSRKAETTRSDAKIRDEFGRYLPGHPGGPGNPHAKKISMFKSAVMRTIAPEELGDVVKMLLDKALSGDIAAAKIILEYTLGKSKPLPAGPVGPRVDIQAAIFKDTPPRGQGHAKST